MTPEQVARAVIPSPAAIASYEGEQATRAYAIKRAGDFRFWQRVNEEHADRSKATTRKWAILMAKAHEDAATALMEVVRLLDETRAARMEAKGLDPTL
jgi:hypothetical protein